MVELYGTAFRLAQTWVKENNMPFIGEQPAEAASLKVVGRSATVTVELTAGTIVVTTRSGTVSVGVE